MATACMHIRSEERIEGLRAFRRVTGLYRRVADALFALKALAYAF